MGYAYASKLWERILKVWQQLAEDSILVAYDASLLDSWIPVFCRQHRVLFKGQSIQGI